MKNKMIAGALIAAVCAIMLLAGGCSAKDPLSDFEKNAGIDLAAADSIEERDTHGGIQGDGTYVAVIRFSETPEAVTGGEWKRLPLTDTLKTALYGFTDGTGEYMIMPLIDFESAGIDTEIPYVENGYYYFEDRHRKSADPSDDTDLLARASYNFTLAVYDSDTDTMYVIIEDT